MKQYIKGNGLDVSKIKSKGITAKHKYIEPNNLYTLKDEGIEAFDFIYSEFLVNSTKFNKILFQEWFYAVKPKGHIIFKFIPKDENTWEQVLLDMELMFKDRISFESKTREGAVWTFVVKKEKENISKPQGINDWSFGILTMGNKNDVVDEMIESIQKQKIPNYEIIVCGTYKDVSDSHIRVVAFDENVKPGWITRKKNMICDLAKYENIVIMHDRIALMDDWFKGMKKYGNNFNVISCKQEWKGERAFDWITTGYPYEDQRSRWYLKGFMEYSDWDPWVYIDGGVIILKKYCWVEVGWNENLFWKQDEDLRLSHDQTRNGQMIRFNPYSEFKILSFRHKISKLRMRFNKHKLGGIKGPLFIVIGRYVQNTLMHIKGFYRNKIQGRYFKPNEGE